MLLGDKTSSIRTEWNWQLMLFISRQDSQGKPVQISAEAFQKLLASRSVRPAGPAAAPPSGNVIRIQRPQNLHPGGDASVVQVVQRPIVRAAEAPRQTVVKVRKLCLTVSLTKGRKCWVRVSFGTSVGKV